MNITPITKTKYRDISNSESYVYIIKDENKCKQVDPFLIIDRLDITKKYNKLRTVVYDSKGLLHMV